MCCSNIQLHMLHPLCLSTPNLLSVRADGMDWCNWCSIITDLDGDGETIYELLGETFSIFNFRRCE
jgi:hypothetical protein